MPTYEYECNNCGRIFEQFQRITESPLSKCPTCGGSVKRLIGAGSGIIFKGSGFYITDYKRKDNKKETDSNKTVEKVDKKKPDLTSKLD